MYSTNETVITRPAHPFDLPRATVWLLASVGSASLSLAHSLDAALARQGVRHESVDRPRARLGPSQTVQARHLIPDSWKVR
jgi:hypothetical protein